MQPQIAHENVTNCFDAAFGIVRRFDWQFSGLLTFWLLQLRSLAILQYVCRWELESRQFVRTEHTHMPLEWPFQNYRNDPGLAVAVSGFFNFELNSCKRTNE